MDHGRRGAQAEDGATFAFTGESVEPISGSVETTVWQAGLTGSV